MPPQTPTASPRPATATPPGPGTPDPDPAASTVDAATSVPPSTWAPLPPQTPTASPRPATATPPGPGTPDPDPAASTVDAATSVPPSTWAPAAPTNPDRIPTASDGDTTGTRDPSPGPGSVHRRCSDQRAPQHVGAAAQEVPGCDPTRAQQVGEVSAGDSGRSRPHRHGPGDGVTAVGTREGEGQEEEGGTGRRREGRLLRDDESRTGAEGGGARAVVEKVEGESAQARGIGGVAHLDRWAAARVGDEVAVHGDVPACGDVQETRHHFDGGQRRFGRGRPGGQPGHDRGGAGGEGGQAQRSQDAGRHSVREPVAHVDEREGQGQRTDRLGEGGGLRRA